MPVFQGDGDLDYARVRVVPHGALRKYLASDAGNVVIRCSCARRVCAFAGPGCRRLAVRSYGCPGIGDAIPQGEKIVIACSFGCNLQVRSSKGSAMRERSDGERSLPFHA